MKLRLEMFIVATVLLIVSGCSHDEPEALQPGQVTFSFNKSDNTAPTGKVKDLPTPAFVSYTIKKPDGSIVSSKIELFLFNERFVTDPQQLAVGHYELQQFLILAPDNSVIYATPLASSDMAAFVERPLPFSFDITADGTTTVVPEVLALEDHTPEDFGYVTFGFNVVEVAAIEIPLAAIEEEITKISYEFTNTTGTIAAEVVPSGAVHTLNIPELLDQTWQATIIIWGRKDCYQKIYRYKNEVTLTGAVLKLAPVEHESWTPFYYFEENNHIKILLSMVDPLGAYHVELQHPSNVGIFGGFLDRYYDGMPDSEDLLCQSESIDLVDGDNRTLRASMTAPECDPIINEVHAYQVVSFVSIQNGPPGEGHGISQYFFTWDVIDGVMKLHCP